jgi:hypothetical protein
MKMLRIGWRAAAAIVASVLMAVPAVAAAEDVAGPAGLQAPPPAAPPDQPQGEKPPTPKKKIDDQTTGTSNDRLFWLLPNFLTVKNAKDVPPLTTGEKYKLVAQGSFDIVEYPWYAVLAGISQVNNSEPGYGLGFRAYGKRYAASFADGTIENFMVGAVLPSMWHEDPRYYQLGTGGVAHRIGYSVSRIFVTRTDSGHAAFNFSEIVGGGIAAGLANTYHPKGDRTLANTLSVWRTLIGYDALTMLMKEFWPDLHRALRRRHAPKATPSLGAILEWLTPPDQFRLQCCSSEARCAATS